MPFKLEFFTVSIHGENGESKIEAACKLYPSETVYLLIRIFPE